MSNYKRLFLNGYEYVFITVVTYNRQNILIDNIELLRNSFKYAKSKINFYIYACIILGNHFHCILSLENEKEYPEIIRLIKYYFSTHINLNSQLTASKIKKGEKGVWQRRYWEHIIRNEKDLNMHLDYIHFNSYKHYNIAPKDWIYSSFQKFVKFGYYGINWLNQEDKNSIKDKNFE